MHRKTESDQEAINDFKGVFLFDYGRLVTHPTIKHKYKYNKKHKHKYNNSLLLYLEKLIYVLGIMLKNYQKSSYQPMPHLVKHFNLHVHWCPLTQPKSPYKNTDLSDYFLMIHDVLLPYQ